MASNELIIDDEYCRSMGAYFESQGEQLDTFIVDYVEILEEVKAKAIMSGEVSNALSTYISYVNQLKSQIGLVSRDAKREIEGFLTRVDIEDQFLF